MSKNQQQFQKAFLMQMRATLTGNPDEASRARQMVSFYKRKLKQKS